MVHFQLFFMVFLLLLSIDFILIDLNYNLSKVLLFHTEFSMHKEFYGLDPMAQKSLENTASSIYLKSRVANYYKLTDIQTEDIIKDKKKKK